MPLPIGDPHKDLVEGAATVVPRVYNDALQPALREIGSALGRVVKIALSPVRALAWTWEHSESWLEEEVTQRFERRKIPQERVVTPSPQLTAQIIRGVQAAGPEADSTLRDLFANLLAAAMDLDSAERVHPAFAEILTQITPDEAKLLKLIAQHEPSQTVVSVRVDVIAGAWGRNLETVYDQATPLLGHLRKRGMLGPYLDNLERLGIIEQDVELLDDPRMRQRREGGIEGLVNDIAANTDIEAQEDRLRAYLAEYDAIEVRSACEVLAGTGEKIKASGTKMRARLTVRLISATSFGEQLLLACMEPDESDTQGED